MPVAERDYMKDGWRPRRTGSLILFLVLLPLVVVIVVVSLRIRSTSHPIQSNPAIVDVNSATVAELEALPYISEKVAVAIVEGRPYARPEDLLRVRGIGPQVLERIRPHIRIVPRAVDQPLPRN